MYVPADLFATSRRRLGSLEHFERGVEDGQFGGADGVAAGPATNPVWIHYFLRCFWESMLVAMARAAPLGTVRMLRRKVPSTRKKPAVASSPMSRYS